MARRASAELAMPAPAGKGARVPRILFWSVSALVAATVAVVVGMRVEHFLINDPRFLLPSPPVLGMATENFQVSGIFYTSEAQVQRVFVRDFGRSLYLCPIAERRRMLLAIDWVEDATVLRIWPNRIRVVIDERRPVAFAQLTSFDGSITPRLIDAHGVLLEPQRAVKLRLPVLSGIKVSDSQLMRQRKVERLLKLQSDLGSRMDRIVDVDIADLGNIVISLPVEGRMITLLLGSGGYRQKLENLLSSYAEISKRIPDATVLDLRVPGRITAAAGHQDGETQAGGQHAGKS